MKIAVPQNHPQKLQFWIVWLTMLGGLPLIQIFAAGGWPEGDDQGEVPQSLVLITLAGVIASTIIRWMILPRIKNPQSLLTTMTIGLALAEVTGLLGMFVIDGDFPETQRFTFCLSLLGMLQFIPIYANKLKEMA